MDNGDINLMEKYNKHITFYKNLSEKIAKMFNIILKNLYEDSEDIIQYKTNVYIVCNQDHGHYFLCESVEDKFQIFISEEKSLLKYDKNSVIYYCTIGSFEINLGFLFETDYKQLSILYSVSKNFFLYLEKGLHYIFNTNSTLFMDTNQIEHMNLNLEEDIVISRSIIEFFYMHFNLDINLLVNLSSTTYEGIATKCKIIKTKRGFKRSKSRNKSGIKVLFENAKSFNQNSLHEIRKLLENERLKVIILEAINQRHGTLLIIGEETQIQNESVRLCNYSRGIIIKRLNIYQNKDIIQLLTNIDGAILLDSNGYCYGIGIILDGDAVVNGTTARGARYNSALNYIHRRKQKGESYTAIIISEDKTVDFIIPENI